MNKKNVFLSLVFAGLCAVSAMAQVYIPPPPPTPDMSNLIWNTYTMNQIGISAIGQAVVNDQMTKGKAGGNRKNAPKNTAANVKPVYSAKLSFEPSGYSLLAEKIAQNANKKMSAAERQQLEKVFSTLQASYKTSFKEEHEKLGLPYNDIATAITFYIANSYLIANGLNYIEPEKILATYNQIASVMLADQKLAKISDKDKELLAEVFIVAAGTPNLVNEETGDYEQVKKAAWENLERVFGKNAAKVSMTESGIEINQK